MKSAYYQAVSQYAAQSGDRFDRCPRLRSNFAESLHDLRDEED